VLRRVERADVEGYQRVGAHGYDPKTTGVVSGFRERE
jgi:hypothetical protein